MTRQGSEFFSIWNHEENLLNMRITFNTITFLQEEKSV